MPLTAPQSSPALCRLPACAIALLVLLTTRLDAQDRFRVTSETSFRRSANGVVLGTLPAGATITARSSSGGWVEYRLEGWIFTPSTAPTNRDGFDLVVQPSRENVRAEPNGTIVARVVSGALLNRLETRGSWSRVRRDVWVARSALQPLTAGAATARREPARPVRTDSSAAGTGPAEATSSDMVEATGESRLLSRPDGDVMGTLAPGTRARVLSRSGEWTRVQVEAWVKDGDVRPAPDSGVLAGITAAELRAAPGRYLGRMVEWRLQFLSLEKGDELRPEIPAGRQYLLTRGPLPETGFVYVILPADQVERFRTLPPLEQITVRGTVRAAATRYLPNPVIELDSVRED